jgi:C4-type Zn-finger protein
MKYRVKSIGANCPKCKNPMETREHTTIPVSSFFFIQWDVCRKCHHVQLYPEFRSTDSNLIIIKPKDIADNNGGFREAESFEQTLF